MNNKEPLFMMQDSWVKYYSYEAIYCGICLSILLLLVDSKFTFLFIPLYFIIFLLNMNDEYYIYFYDDKILYNQLNNVTAGFLTKHKYMDIANVSSLKIYRYFYGIGNNKKPMKNNFFKFLEIIFSCLSGIFMFFFPKILYLLGRSKYKNTNALIIVDKNTYEYIVVILSMLDDNKIKSLNSYLIEKFSIDLDSIETKNFFINFNY